MTTRETGSPVRCFLVELYAARAGGDTLGAYDGRARAAARELELAGTPIRYLHAIAIPADETCLLLFEAPSVSDVAAALTRAGITFDRVVEAAFEDES